MQNLLNYRICLIALLRRHPSDSTEQQLAHKEILVLLNDKYQLNLESKKVIN